MTYCRWTHTYKAPPMPDATPIRANTNNSCGSNGKSMVKLVRKTAVTVSAPSNHTANNRNIVAPHTAAKKPLQ